MNVTFTIFDTTPAAELNATSTFLCDLADIRSEYDFPKEPAVTGTTAAPAEGAAPARKTRRTKAQIEAAAAAQPTPTEAPAEAPADAPAETPAAAEAAPTGNKDWGDSGAVKTYTEADVQALATLVARAKGPDAVKEKIAELGGARIADLDADKLNQLGAFLEEQK